MNKPVTLTTTSTSNVEAVSNTLCASTILAAIGTVALIVLLIL